MDSRSLTSASAKRTSRFAWKRTILGRKTSRAHLCSDLLGPLDTAFTMSLKSSAVSFFSMPRRSFFQTFSATLPSPNRALAASISSSLFFCVTVREWTPGGELFSAASCDSHDAGDVECDNTMGDEERRAGADGLRGAELVGQTGGQCGVRALGRQSGKKVSALRRYRAVSSGGGGALRREQRGASGRAAARR